MRNDDRSALTAIVAEASARADAILAEHETDDDVALPAHAFRRLAADACLVEAGLALLAASRPPTDLLEAVELEAGQRVRDVALEWLGPHDCPAAPHVGASVAADVAILEVTRRIRAQDDEWPGTVLYLALRVREARRVLEQVLRQAAEQPSPDDDARIAWARERVSKAETSFFGTEGAADA